MPRIVLTVEDLPADELINVAEREAQELNFEVLDTGKRHEFRAQKGSMLVSLIAGPFTLYCDFSVSVERGRVGERELLIEWDTPWWTGIFGVGRTEKAARELADSIEDAIEIAGGRVDDRRKT